MESQVTTDAKPGAVQSRLPVSEPTGWMRMTSPFGLVDGVHGLKPADREISQHQLAGWLQHPEHLAEHPGGIVEMMKDVPRSHCVEAARRPW
jgi:hypothetical protein